MSMIFQEADDQPSTGFHGRLADAEVLTRHKGASRAEALDRSSELMAASASRRRRLRLGQFPISSRAAAPAR